MKLHAILILLSYYAWAMPLQAELLNRISLNPKGIDANSSSLAPSMSVDGRYIAFHSAANNIDFSDTNGFVDVFVYDRYQQNIQRVSLNSAGEQADFISQFPAISGDGRSIAFQSDASNLVPNDSNRTTDIFVRDLVTGTTERVSVSSNGREAGLPSIAPSISADGRYVVFYSESSTLVRGDTNRLFDIFLHDRDTDTTLLISRNPDGSATDGFSFNPMLSGDGRTIVYTSEATQLVADDTNNMADIFVYDREAETTRRINLNAAGEQANDDSLSPAISSDGRYIVFASRATNLIVGDDNAAEDIFLYDQQADSLTRVNVSSAGLAADADAANPAISGDGRYIAFSSAASNLVAGDVNEAIDVFIHDRDTATTRLLSVQQQVSSPAAASFFPPALSEDGRWIAFESRMASLVNNDFNGVSDIFVYDQAYTARFNPLTAQLHLPAVLADSGETYSAILTLAEAAPLQFELSQLQLLTAELGTVPVTYNATTGEVDLPVIEVLPTQTALDRYTANMRLQADGVLFEVIELDLLDKQN